MIAWRPYNDDRIKPENGIWLYRHAIQMLDASTSSSKLTDENIPSRSVNELPKLTSDRRQKLASWRSDFPGLGFSD